MTFRQSNQEINGIDMGCNLHSTNNCSNILNHIGDEMRTNVAMESVMSNSEISLIIDESTRIVENL
jgi:hypothetical protein